MKIISKADARAQGLRFYFNGIPCCRGHVVERIVCNSTCAECNRNLQNRHWRKKNPKKLKTCVVCGKELNGNKTKICSHDCKLERYRQIHALDGGKKRREYYYTVRRKQLGHLPTNKNCVICGEIFLGPRHIKTCSNICKKEHKRLLHKEWRDAHSEELKKHYCEKMIMVEAMKEILKKGENHDAAR